MTDEEIRAYRAAEERLFAEYGVDVVEHFVDVSDPSTKVRVLQVGSPDASPVLCFHGSPNAATSWIPLAAQLPGYRMLLLDTPGAGLSEPVAQWDRHREQTVAVVAAVLEALELESVDLIGSSLGGLYAYNFALTHPGQVTSLIQMGCPSGPALVPITFFERILALPIPTGLLMKLVQPTIEGARKSYAEIGHAPSIDAGIIPPITFEWYAELMRSTDTVRNTLPEIRAIDAFTGRRPAGRVSDEEIAGLSMPTLYLWGDADPMATPAHGDRLAALTPGARIDHFPGFGHLPWYDDAAAIAERVRAFLRASASSGFTDQVA